MDNIFIDPVVVTTPPIDANREEIEKWLSDLQIWLKEALSAHYNWLHSVPATNLLEENERFPSFETLRFWQRKYRLDINPSLIVRDISSFFRDEAHDLHGALEVLGYLIEAENNSIVIRPPLFVTRWLDCIRSEMQQVLVTTCACKYTGHPFTQKMHIVTLELPVREREVEVCATIVDAIPDIPLDIDNRISQVFPLLFTPEDLLPLLDVVALWTQGEGGIRYAIEQQFKKDWQSAVTQPIQFRFGTHFIASVNDSRLDTDEVVLTKIARIVAAIIANKATEVNCDLRQLRASRTADSPQRTRTSDGAEAWRLTLTKHGVGWRMHYWRIPGPDGGIIEFANVLKKHDPEEIC